MSLLFLKVRMASRLVAAYLRCHLISSMSHCVRCWLGLGGSWGVENKVEGWVNCPLPRRTPTTCQEIFFSLGLDVAGDVLFAFAYCLACAVIADCMWIGLHLWFVGKFVAKTCDCYLDIPRHGQMYLALDVLWAWGIECPPSPCWFCSLLWGQWWGVLNCPS